MGKPGLERLVQSLKLWALGGLCGAWAAQLLILLYTGQTLNYSTLTLCVACGLAISLILWHLVLDPLFYRFTRRAQSELTSVVFLCFFIGLVGSSRYVSIALVFGLVLALVVGRLIYHTAKDNSDHSRRVIFDLLRRLAAVFVILASAASLVVAASEHSLLSRASDALAFVFLVLGAGEYVQIQRNKPFGVTTLVLLSCSLLATNLEFTIGQLWFCNPPPIAPSVTQDKLQLAAATEKEFKTTRHELPRIILISIDTLRADALSCYGSRNKTPALDALAASSVLYEQAIAPSPWTLPSLVSILTGLDPSQHRVTDDDSTLPESIMTLGDILLQHGYFTAFIGWNQFLKKGRGIDRGFQRYQIDFPGEGDTTQPIGEQVIQFLHRRSDLDFFLWVHFFDPHLRYNPPAQFAPSAPEVVAFQKEFPELRDIRAGYFKPSTQQLDWTRQLYQAEVRYVDHKIFQITQTLRKLQLYDDTLIILASDHGEELWEHGGFEHGHSLHHEVLHVPLLIKKPKQKSVQRISQPVSTTRLFATILQQAGIQAPKHTRRPLPSASQRVFQPIVSAYLKYYQPQRSIYFDSWKYIQQLSSQQQQLYHLRRDPAEQQSVAENKPKIVHKAQRLIEEIEREAAQDYKDLVKTPTQPLQLDGETQEQLRSLGYVR